MDAVIKPSPVPSSPTTKSPFRGMPDRSSGFKNRTPSKLGADGEAVNGGRNGFTAVEFRSEWEDELERRAQRRRESESLREEGESPLGSGNSPSPPIPPPRAPRNESESAPSSAGPVPPPRRQISNEQQRQREAAAALEAAVQRAAEVGAADYAALEEAEGLGKSPTTKSPTPPPRLIRSAGSSGGSEKVIREKGTPSSSPRQEGDPDPSAARSFAGTKWVAKPGGPQRRPLHPLRPPPPPEEEEEEEPPPPDPLATAMNSSKVVGNFMLSAVEGAKTLAKEVVPLSPKGKYAGDGGAERDNIFRQKARFEASVRKEAEAKLQAVMPSFLQRTTDAEGASKLKAQIEAAKAAGVAGPVLAAAEQKLKAFAVGEENRQRAQSERLRKETEKAELTSPAGIARRAAEDQLRAVYPFPGMFADPAKLKPAIEAAKEAGVAAPIVAMAEAKLKEAEEKAKRAAAEKALKQTGTDAKKAKTAAAEDVDGDEPLAYKDVAPGEKAAVAAVAEPSGNDYIEDEPLDTDAKGAAAAVRRTAVAFFGNSILYYNDTPRLIESLSGGSVEQNSCLRGGVTFEQLLSKGNGMDVKFVSEDKGAPDVASLLSRSWHYVVMNDYTQAPAREESRRASVEVLKTQIAPLLEQCGGTPVLLETWAYRAHTKGSDDLGDHAEFTSRLQEGYREYAAALAEVLPEKQKPRVRCSPMRRVT